MILDLAKQPERLRVVRWDGDNVDEVNNYIAEVHDPTGTAEVIVNEDGSAYVRSPMGDKPLTLGAFVHAIPYMWGGPIITVYSPGDANAQLYAYPTFEPVAQEPPNSDV